MKIVENIPENVKGVILMICGFALLLHTIGVLADLLWYVLLAISLYLIFVGFVKVKGVEAVRCIITKKNKEVINFEASQVPGSQDKNK